MPDIKNLRNMSSPVSKNGREAKGAIAAVGAEEGADLKANNDLKEYVAPDPPTGGPLGGKHSGS